MTMGEMNRLSHSLRLEEMYPPELRRQTRLLETLAELERLGADKEWIKEQRITLRRQREQTRKSLAECKGDSARLLEIIDNAPDQHLRRAMMLRFVHRCRWDSVAAKLGGGNTADTVRKMVERHLASIQV